MNRKKHDKDKLLFICSLFIAPILGSFFIIVMNNYEKFNSIFKTATLLLLIISLIVLILSFSNLAIQNRLFNKNKMFTKSFLVILFLIYVTGIGTVVNYVYYNENFKSWLITTSAASLNHKDLADSIYSKYTVTDVLESNDEVVEDEVIDFSVQYSTTHYANKYEEELFEDYGDKPYKIVKITGQTYYSGSDYVGYIALIKDPSHIRLAKSSGAGTFEGSYGETLATIAKKNKALLAINAGGFYDPEWNSNGGIPHGDVFIDGELDSSYSRANFGGGIIGFDKDNKLILKRMSTEEAMALGIQNAVDWGPYLIIDGVNQYRNSTPTWECARTAIGQRADGSVLFLVIDGLQEHSKGASYKDVADIMERFGAINAANLDGGTSTSMVENGKYINSPWNGTRPTFRWFPNAWIVVE